MIPLHEISIRICRQHATTYAKATIEALKLSNFILHHILLADRFNTSIVRDGSCWESLVSNKSDLVPHELMYPVSDRGFGYFGLTDQAHNTMVSSFVPLNHTELRMDRANVLSGFTGFSFHVRLISFFFLVTFFILFTIYSRYTRNFKRFTSRIRKCRPRERRSVTPGQLVTGMLLKQYTCCASLERKKSSFQFTLLLFILLVSVLHAAFVSNIKTSLVVNEKPEIIESYVTLVNHPVATPVWLHHTDAYKTFRDADPGSIERRLWIKTLNSKYSPLVKMNFKMIYDLVKNITSGKIVLIVKERVGKLVHAACCPAAHAWSMNPVIIRADRQSRSFPMALIYNEQMNKRAVPPIRKKLGQAVQSGLIAKHQTVTGATVSVFSDAAVMRNCLLQRNEQKSDEAPAVLSKSLDDFKEIWYVGSLSYVLALVVDAVYMCARRVILFRQHVKVASGT